jgi:sugar (pentulose or hexulose) kinase
MSIAGSRARTSQKTYAGFDFGTSGARLCVVATSSPRNDNYGPHSLSTSSSSSPFEELYSDSILWAKDDDDTGDKINSPGSYDDPQAWTVAADTLLRNIASKDPALLSSLEAICVSGTSASCLMVDTNNCGAKCRSGKARMYDYDVMNGAEGGADLNGIKAMDLLEQYAPPKHTTLAKTSSLAKLVKWHMESPIKKGEALAHQADYVSVYLTQGLEESRRCGAGQRSMSRTISSDWHNCLKLGYDVRKLEWPSWLLNMLQDAGVSDPLKILPYNVVSPGQIIGNVSEHMVQTYALSQDTKVVGGTTDSNAAFFAATEGSLINTEGSLGTAVTSLGSTLALKQLSSTYVEDATRGVYSHRFPQPAASSKATTSAAQWLIGGASNVGCAILRRENYSTEELHSLSRRIDPMLDSPLEYYPLTKQGERFPVADSSRQPCLDPKPSLMGHDVAESNENGYSYDRTAYLHGLFQGIAKVECDGYRALSDLISDQSKDGSLKAKRPRPTRVYSCGGGSKNDIWTTMRQRLLKRAFSLDAGGNGGTSDSGTNSASSTSLPILVTKATNTEASFGAALLAASSFESA